MQSYDLPDDVNYDLIEPGLYLGNLSTAVSIATLQSLNISHILTVASEPLPSGVLTSLPSVKNLYIQVDDVPGSDLFRHFASACEFISSAQQEGTAVLVHCYYGVSRSATLVAAHLMRKHSLTAAQAIHRMKQQRRCVGPNVGFLEQLSLFQALQYSCEALGLATHCYRLYKLNMMIAVVSTEPHRLPPQLRQYLQEFAHDPPVNSSPGLMCRTCSVVLCSASAILHHRPSCTPQLCTTNSTSTHSGSTSYDGTNNGCSNNSSNSSNNSASSSNESSENTGNSSENTGENSLNLNNDGSSSNDTSKTEEWCSRGYYITPQSWMMGPGSSKLTGPITCFSCSGTIGAYHWLRGVACPCFTDTSEGASVSLPLANSTKYSSTNSKPTTKLKYNNKNNKGNFSSTKKCNSTTKGNSTRKGSYSTTTTTKLNTTTFDTIQKVSTFSGGLDGAVLLLDASQVLRC